MDVTIYFDIDGTLLHRADHDDDITGAADAFDLSIDEAAISLYRGLVDGYFQRNAVDPYRQGIERWVDHYGFDVDPEAVTEELKRTQIEDTRTKDGLRDTLDRLADRATLGILTNGAGDMQREKLDRHDLSRFFETALISGETDSMKPRDGFFAAAKRELPADRHVYVGDRIGTDIVPARENDFLAVLVGDRSPLADRTVESVGQLSAERLFDGNDRD